MLWIWIGVAAAVVLWAGGLVWYLQRRRRLGTGSSQVADLERRLEEERARARLLEARLTDRPQTLEGAAQLRAEAARLREEAQRIVREMRARQGAPLPPDVFNNLFAGLFRNLPDLPNQEALLADLERQLQEGAETATTRQGNATVTVSRRSTTTRRTNSDLNELLDQAGRTPAPAPPANPPAPPRAWYERLRDDPWPKNENETSTDPKPAEKPSGLMKKS